MDKFTLMSNLIMHGYDIQIKLVKTVVNNVDTTLVSVTIDKKESQGATLTEAFTAACEALRVKVDKRHTKDADTIAFLEAAQ